MTMKKGSTSSDGYVRIPTGELATVQLRHLFSQQDSSIATPPGLPGSTSMTMTGITEWAGSWGDQTVSVGWDWGVVDSIVVLLSAQEIRTNIRLVTEDQSPVPPVIAQIHLFHWIETMPWREVAVNDLFRRP